MSREPELEPEPLDEREPEDEPAPVAEAPASRAAPREHVPQPPRPEPEPELDPVSEPAPAREPAGARRADDDDELELDLPDDPPPVEDAPRKRRGFLRRREPASPPPSYEEESTELDLPDDDVWTDQPLEPRDPVEPVAEQREREPPTPDEALYENRTVRGVPSNAELKLARALELFNASPHTRTVSGVSRTLGAPLVCARPSATEGSVVTIVVGWELSWYRYEIDLGDEQAGTRVVAQGSELDELDASERRANATADAEGLLHAGAAVS